MSAFDRDELIFNLATHYGLDPKSTGVKAALESAFNAGRKSVFDAEARAESDREDEANADRAQEDFAERDLLNERPYGSER